MVARVVASRESMPIGIEAPARTASTNSFSSVRCPLSWPPLAFVVLVPRSVQTAALRKLSSRALRPPPVASIVSFGYRTLPPVR